MRERNKQQTGEYFLQSLLLEVARQVLASSGSEAELSAAVFALIRDPLEVDALFNYRMNERGLELVAGCGIPAHVRNALEHLEVGRGFCGAVASTAQAIAADSARIATDPDGALFRSIGITAYACHPLLGKEGRVMGTFSAASTRRQSFNAQEVHFLQSVSDFIALSWERRRAEREAEAARSQAERQRRLYEAILTNTPDLAYVFNLDHRFIYANDGLLRMWGKTWDEAIGRTCLELGYEPWHAAMHGCEIDQIVATGRPVRGEVPFSGTFGRRAYDYILVPVFGPDGSVEAVAGTTRDVTEYRDAQNRRDEFIATLSHELRNPLAPIRNALYVLRAADRSGAHTELHDMMQRQVGSLVRLVDDLLEISRISRGVLELRMSDVELGAVVREAIESTTPAFLAGGHAPLAAHAEAPVWVRGDRVRLVQIVTSLLNNAAAYTPPGAPIDVVCTPVDDVARIVVSDMGAGIGADTMPHIFEMFSRGDDARAHVPNGLGVGLALARWLAELHGGSVEAASEGVGLGSAFTVTLPIGPTPSRTESDAEATDAVNFAGMQVLVVDDNVDAARSLAMVLGLHGAQVQVAANAEAAIALYEATHPEVLLLDIGMPAMNGYDLARRIRAGADGQRPLIAAVSGWGQSADRRKGSEAGFDAHLIKPVDIPALHALLSGRCAKIRHPGC